MSDKKNMKLFSLNSNPEIAQKIADHAGVPLGKISSRQFSDGEIQVNIEESVRGYDIYIGLLLLANQLLLSLSQICWSKLGWIVSSLWISMQCKSKVSSILPWITSLPFHFLQNTTSTKV